MAVGESMTDAWGGGPGQGRSGAHDWEAQRFGANPPAGVVQLRGQVEASIAAAAGVPADLVVQGSTTEALRESWRQFAFGTLMPPGAGAWSGDTRQGGRLRRAELRPAGRG